MLSNLAISYWAQRAYDIYCQFGKKDSVFIRRRPFFFFLFYFQGLFIGNYFRAGRPS